MFFRRKRPVQLTFDDRLAALRSRGFRVEASPDGDGYQVSRESCVAVIRAGAEGAPEVRRGPGLLAGGAIAALVDEGYQKFFRTPDGARRPALAPELRALHAFQEDLREGLNLETFYNESLGTVSTFYLYDRLTGRDRGART